MISEHTVLWKVHWATPLLMICLMAIVLLLLQVVFKDKLQKWGFSMN